MDGGLFIDQLSQCVFRIESTGFIFRLRVHVVSAKINLFAYTFQVGAEIDALSLFFVSQ